MQQATSQQSIEDDVQRELSSHGIAATFTAAELIRALLQKEPSPNMVPAVTALLSHASADLIARVFLSPNASPAEISCMIEYVVTLASNIHCSRNPTLAIELRRVFVPKDFPAQPESHAISGAHPKIALVLYGGKYYEPGTTPPEVLSRWELAEDLALQFFERCRITEKGKYAHLSRKEILQQYLDRLLHTGWGKDADMRWVIRRTAILLEWDIPEGL